MTESESLNVAVRDQNVPLLGDRTLFQALREIGVGSVEAMVDVDERLPCVPGGAATSYSIARPADLEALKHRLAEERVSFCALLAATDFSGPDSQRHVEWATRVVRAASQLGVPVVRIDTLTANKSLAPEQVRENFVRCIRRLLEQTAGSGVDLAMENHGPISNDPAFLDGVLDAVPDARLGLTLDTGNFYWFGHSRQEVYRLIEKYAPRTKHTHIKNVNYPPPLADRRRAIGHDYKQYCSPVDEGSLDLRRMVDILRQSGYRRALCIEDESLLKVPERERITVLRREVEAVRRATS